MIFLIDFITISSLENSEVILSISNFELTPSLKLISKYFSLRFTLFIETSLLKKVGSKKLVMFCTPVAELKFKSLFEGNKMNKIAAKTNHKIPWTDPENIEVLIPPDKACIKVKTKTENIYKNWKYQWKIRKIHRDPDCGLQVYGDA